MSKRLLLLLGASGALALALLYIVFVNPLDGEARSETLRFIGRFHPVVLHLPIALVGLLAIMEWLSLRPFLPQLRPATGLILVLAIGSTLLATATGFLLAFGSGSDEELVVSHMKGAALLALACLGLGALKPFTSRILAKVSYHALLLCSLALVVYASHLGGSITHGRDYLTEYMPTKLRPVFGLETEEPVLVASRQEMLVFRDVVQPIIEQNCQSCHNPDKLKGDLDLTRFDGFLAGGDSGPAVSPGHLEESELYYRITLPRSDDDAMPPDDKPPLSEDEVATLAWWIESGAVETSTVAAFDNLPKRVDLYLSDVFESMLSTAERERLEDERLALYANLGSLKEEIGIEILPIQPKSHYFSVETFSIQRKFDDQTLQKLEPFSDHIVKADFSSTQLTDSSLPEIEKFKNLNSLNLSKTQVTGASIDHLAGLSQLETLNLYGTPLNPEHLSRIGKLKQLKRLYLFQTGLNEESGIASLQEQLPNCEVMF